MNKIYKVIWSKVRNCYVAVSEIAKRNGKSCTSVNCGAKANRGHAGVALSAAVGATLLVGMCSVLLPVRVALAAPVMPTLDFKGDPIKAASPYVTINSTTSDTTATMNISSTQTNNVLKWIDFSIGKGGAVNFTDAHNYLNYVTGHGRSEIDGTLTGAGKIYIVNPNGVLFGDNARVDVGSLYVSTRELGADQFSAFESGNNPLTAGDIKGDVVNLGKLNANNITVEGNNISFKNIADVTKGGALADGDITGGTAHNDSSVTLTANSTGEIHIGSSNGGTPGYSMNGTSKTYMYKLVSTPNELQAIGNNDTTLAGNYMLANDIDLKNGNNYYPFKPIGYTTIYKNPDNTDQDVVFKGRFDGLNYIIKNLRITNDTLPSDLNMRVGLFGYSKGTIENVGVVDTDINVSKEYVGGVVGYNSQGTIRNVYHTGSVSGLKYVGGISGYNYGNNGYIEKAFNSGIVTANADNTSSDVYIGGIVGSNVQGKIREVYNTGDVGTSNSYNSVGGIAGRSYTQNASIGIVALIENSYNTGTVKGYSKVGGIAGSINNDLSVGSEMIKNTYNTGTVEGDTTAGTVGGLVGYRGDKALITSSYFNNGNDNGYGTLKTNQEMHDVNTYSGWSISTEGGSGATWRLYQGINGSDTNNRPTPLLTAFLKPKDLVQVYEYDGNEHMFRKDDPLLENDTNIKHSGVAYPNWKPISLKDAGVDDFSSENGLFDKKVFYSLQNGYDIADMKLIIQPKRLTATFGSNTYNGTAVFTGMAGTLTDVLDGDVGKVSVKATATYVDKNVGEGKTVTYSDITLDGDKKDNYIVVDELTGTGAITKKELNATFDSITKEYDGNDTATENGKHLVGVVDGDTVNFADGITGQFITNTEQVGKNVGTNKDITYSGIDLTGADSSNYSIATTASGKGDITAKPLTVGNVTKVYDGNATATLTVSNLQGVVDGEAAGLSISSGVTANYTGDKAADAGTGKTVEYSGLTISGTASGNYTIAASGTSTMGNSITPKQLSATFNTISKVYDGGTSGTANASLTGVVGSDDVSVTATATYAGQDVGTWGVNYTGIGLTGYQAGNYVLDSTSAADKTIEGNSITAKALTVGNISKVYDGTAEAKLTLDNLIGLVDGDKTSLSISEGVTANYTGEKAADAGTGKTVEYSGLIFGGTKSGNYSIAASGTTTGSITPKVLTASSVSKVYDGTDAATLHLSDLLGTDGLPGVVERDESDLVLTTNSAAYASKNAGTGNVTFNGISLTGDKAHNYTINDSITVQGTITRKALELVADKVTIHENDAMPSSFDGSIIGFIDGEGQNISGLGFSLANPMTTPVVGSYRIVGTLNGDESGNYGLNYTFQNAASNATAFTVKPVLAVLPALDFRGASVNVTIDKSVENVLSIDSTKLYNTLKWIDFSIGENGTVQFDDKNYLNYVTGHGRSDIDGTLTGGGAIYLINPNGVLFGSTAQVNVGNLYVSSRTLDSTALNAFETNGTNPLETPPVSATGNIINRGTLTAAGITVEGNNVSFKNYADVTATGGIKVRADGEVHVGFSNGEEAAAVNDTEYKTVSEPELANWDFKKTDNTTAVTPEKYMLVRNAYELQNMKNNLLGNYMLANDIEFKNDNGGYIIGQFIPIGSLGGWTDYKEGMFKGKLDGLYHVIRDIYIDNTAITQNSNRLTDIGIIGSNAGIVENLGVINGNVNITNSGASAVGGIVGANKPGGIIRNVYFSGSVKGGRTGTGGVAGWQNVGGLTENAYATGSVTSSYSNYPDSILGVIGVTGGSIKNAYFSGKVRNENMNELYKSDGTRQRLTDTDMMKQFATFNSDGVGWDITADGSKNATWRIYEGKTTPLLTAFLKTKSLVTETEYDGGKHSFDTTLVTGNSQVNELDGATYSAMEKIDAGVYNETKKFYSDSQQGYNIVDTKLVIQPKTLTLVNSKTYDGTKNTKGTIGFTGKIDNDDVSLVDGSVTGGIYADKNVGANKAVTYTIADSTLGGTNKANYILTVKGTGTITPKALTATFADITKVYDGTTNATAGVGTLSGVETIDAGKVNVSASASYDEKNAGSRTVNYTGVTLGGTEAANYSIATTATGAGMITPKVLTATFADITKVYDGTTSATAGVGTLSGVETIDAGKVSVSASAAYDQRNAGSRIVNYSGVALSGDEAANYSIATTATGAGTITPKELTATFADIGKTYDGTTSATAGAGTLAGVIAADEGKVSVSASAAYDQKNAGSRIVNYSGVALSGDEAANYSIATTATGAGTITPKALTATFADITKVYDGTTSATAGAGTLSGVETVDTGKISVSASAAYDEKNAGRRTVNYTGVTLSGSEAANYSIATTATGAGTITPKELTATFADISKTYDGTTNAIPGAGTLTGVIDADEGKVSVSASAAYDEKNAGSRTVNYTGVTLSGAEAGNYSIATTATGNGTIGRKALELVADPASTEYGDYNPASFTGRVDGFVAGESVSNGDSLQFALSDPSASAVGSYGITGTINGSSSGDYGLNYTFTNAASNANAFTIYARPASVQDMVLSDIIPGIKGKSGADISVTALDNAMEQARDKRAEVGIEFAVAQTILSVDADRNLSLENRGMKQPPAMTPQEVAEQVHAQQGNGNGVAAQAGGNAGAASGGTNENGAASNAGVTGAVNAAMDVVQQTDDAVGTEESKRKKGVA